MHPLLDAGHGVCSPLGAWLLLALVGGSATGADRVELAEVLGCDPAEARDHALRLLREPPPDVVAAAACWTDASVAGPGVAALRAAVSPPVTTGPIPSRAVADAWAADHTRGLIDRFPIELDRGLPVIAVLATALATRISWREPYLEASRDDLVLERGFEPATLLRAPDRSTWSGIVDARYAAHCASSPDGLQVASVLGAPDAEPQELLAVAQRVAIALADGSEPDGLTPLAELPLGDGPAWRLSETVGGGRPERFETYLPEWEASSRHDLLAAEELGFTAAGRVVGSLLEAPGSKPDAVQAAVARYSRTGFEAAAVTALAMRAAALGRAERRVRVARLEFTRPYAVVAAAGGDGPWRGLPVFAARVSPARPG